MIIEHLGLNQINGSLIVLDGIKNASFDEMVELRLENGTSRTGRIVQIAGEKVIIQVFEGTKGISALSTQRRVLRVILSK
jgi:V/A-type H+-transporting ATPase subunit B